MTTKQIVMTAHLMATMLPSTSAQGYSGEASSAQLVRSFVCGSGGGAQRDTYLPEGRVVEAVLDEAREREFAVVVCSVIDLLAAFVLLLNLVQEFLRELVLVNSLYVSPDFMVYLVEDTARFCLRSHENQRDED